MSMEGPIQLPGEVLPEGRLARARRTVETEAPSACPFDPLGEDRQVTVGIQDVEAVSANLLGHGSGSPGDAHGLEGISQQTLHDGLGVGFPMPPKDGTGHPGCSLNPSGGQGVMFSNPGPP